MSDTNQSQIVYLKETTPGVTPSAALQIFDMTNESLSQNVATQISKTIRADRQVPDIIRVSTSPSGSVGFNWKYTAADDFLAGFMMNPWASNLSLTGIVSSSASPQKFISNSSSGGPSFATIKAGMWVKVSGFVGANNNGFFKVMSVDTTVATAHTIVVAQGTTLTAESLVASVKINGTVVFNGTTYTSFSMQLENLDITKFDSFKGMAVSKWALNIKASEPITSSFDFNGTFAASTQTTTIGSGSDLPPPSTQELNAIDHVLWVKIGGVTTVLDLTELSIDADNKLRPRFAISSIGPRSIGLGQIDLKGKLGAYYVDRTLLDLARGHTQTALSFALQDTLGNTYIVDMEGVYLSNGDPTVSGIDADIITVFDFNAKIGGTSGKMIGITKFASTD